MTVNKRVKWSKGGIKESTVPKEWYYKVVVEPQPIMKTCSRVLQPESDPHFFGIPVLYTLSRKEAFSKQKEYAGKSYSGHNVYTTVQCTSGRCVSEHIASHCLLEFFGSQKVLSYRYDGDSRYLLIETENEGTIRVYHMPPPEENSILSKCTVYGGSYIANGITAKGKNNIELVPKFLLGVKPLSPPNLDFNYQIMEKYKNKDGEWE